MPVFGNYVSGQILYAANLNASFAQAAAVAGDSFGGTVTAPNLNSTGTTYTNTLIANTAVVIQGFDVRTGILQAAANANSAYAQANTAFTTANNQAALIQAAYNQANAAFNQANTGISTGGALITGGLTVNNTINASNTITSNAEIHGTANAQVFGGQVRLMQGNYGAILRNDGANLSVLTTGNVPVGSVGTAQPNGITPLRINLTTGALSLDANGIGTTFGGNVTTTNINAQYANVAAFRNTTLTSNNTYVLSPSDSGTVIFYNNSQPVFINVNSNLFVGFRTVVTQVNSGSVTFRVGPNVIMNPRIGTLNQITGIWASASLACYGANTFILDGSIQ